MLVYRGGGVKISGCRGMSVGIEANICHRCFGAVLVWRGPIVLYMKNVSLSEGSCRESIFSLRNWFCVPSMRYIGSP